MNDTTLYIFAGLPGSGKTTIARMLSAHLDCMFLRIDTIEQALRDLCSLDVEGEGYRLAYRVAVDNLRIGRSVVADSCNPIDLTRNEWIQVAEAEGSQAINIEVTCSDPIEHQRRVEQRNAEIPGLILPTWKQVLTREYHPWTMSRIILDTAGSNPDSSFQLLLKRLGQ
jgi:predicted kinase